MGVYARDHAHQLILDRAPHGERSPLSPRAMMLLSHIAQRFGGDQDIANRKIMEGKLWNREAVYLEGLGKKARAIGYNVPEKINGDTVSDGEMTEPQVRAVKAAVGKAIKELVDAGLLTQTRRGQTGQNPTYALHFLKMGCSRCMFTTDDGQRVMDENLHLSKDQRQAALDRIEDHRQGLARQKREAAKPKSTGWGIKAPTDPWDAPPTDGWGKPSDDHPF